MSVSDEVFEEAIRAAARKVVHERLAHDVEFRKDVHRACESAAEKCLGVHAQDIPMSSLERAFTRIIAAGI